MTEFSGKAAVVTGAGAGIGRATALALAERGCAIVVADVDESGARETVELITGCGGRAVFAHVDVRRATDCQAMVAAALEHFGRLDIAFNNAGVVARPALTADCELAEWQRIIDINLTGVFNCMKVELPAMRATGGAIVNTASIMGVVGAVGGAAYCASKHGVIGLTKAAALEYGRRAIRVNAICPGFVETQLTVGESTAFTPEKLQAGLDRTALKRLASPEQVAALVLWLCSDAASYMTGASIPVDGGYTAS